MFSLLQSEIISSLSSCEMFLAAACRPGFPQNASAAKGLAFVELYATYEYAVRTAVRAAIDEIKTHGNAINRMIPELLSLLLDAQITSVADSGRDRLWPRRIELFVKSCSSDPVDVSENAFPFDGSHFRLKQLRTIWTG